MQIDANEQLCFKSFFALVQAVQYRNWDLPKGGCFDEQINTNRKIMKEYGMHRCASLRFWPQKKSLLFFSTSLFTGLLASIIVTMLVISRVPVAAQDGPNLEDLTTFSDLQAIVNEQGSIRVIVQVDTTFTPIGELSFLAGITQEWRIDRAQQSIGNQLDTQNATVVSNFKTIPYMVLEVNAAGLAELTAMDSVISIEEDRLEYLTLSDSIPNIQGDQVWTAGYTGSGQVVAIIDTGVETDHDAFGNGSRVVAEACYSTTSVINNTVSACPEGVTSSTATGSGVDCVDRAITLGYSGAADDCTHGTHVAGIVVGDDGSSNIGVARGANIIVIQAASIVTSSDSVGFYTSDIIYALQRVLTLHNSGNYTIAAVNMSLGGNTEYSGACDSSELARKAAIDNLRSVGIATIVASGNNGFTNGISSPACISSAISVGATYDSNDQIVDFSNVGSILDLLAPGLYINAAMPGNGTGSKSGTSMAAPHVAGAWALAREAMPSASVDDILTAFKDTGTLIDDNTRRDASSSIGDTGSGIQNIPRINVLSALQAIPTPTPTSTATTASTPTSTPTDTTMPPTATSTATPLPPTNTPTSTPTNTDVPPTATPTATDTAVPPTPTATSTPSDTAIAPTATPTGTPVLHTATSTTRPTNTMTSTTTAEATVTTTATDSATATSEPTAQPTQTPTIIPTVTTSTGDAQIIIDPNQATTFAFTTTTGSQLDLQLPAGAVDQSTTLVIQQLASPTNLPDSLQFAGQIFALNAYQQNGGVDSFTFTQPIILTIDYTDADIASLNESTLMLYYFDTTTGEWQTDGITVIERLLEQNRIVLALSHLTDFALFTVDNTPTEASEKIYLPIVTRRRWKLDLLIKIDADHYCRGQYCLQADAP